MTMKTTDVTPPFSTFEALEERKLMVYWPSFVGLDKVISQYSWLNGGGNGVAVIDKGIDYLHPQLGGNPTTGAKSPRIVNVYDYQENDTDPFPEDVDPADPDPATGHGTGVAGLLAGTRYTDPKDGKSYQGVLQNSLLYSFRQSETGNQQGSLAQALQWVLDHHVEYHITAVNLTDFVGTTASIPVYQNQIQALWNAGVWIGTPVANNWLGDPDSNTPAHTSIGYPGSSPYIFATGGLDANGTGVRAESQRGAALDLLAPAVDVHLPYYDPTSSNPHIWTPYGTGNSWGLPMITGTAVLLQQLDPTITPAEIVKLMQDAGTYVADSAANAAITGVAGYKRLDIFNTVKLAYQQRDDASDSGAGNDSQGTASTITLDSTGKGSVTGRKLLIHDDDFYTFTVGQTGTYDLDSLAGAQLMNGSGAVIGTVGSTGRLRQSLAAGQYYVHLYDAAKSLTGTYSVAIQQAPAALPASFTSTPRTITIAFSANVGASLAAADLRLVQRLPNGASGTPFSPTSVTFDTTTNTARFTFATAIPDGDYRASITAANVTDSGGHTLAADFAADFFVLAGDATHDRVVNFDDLLALAKNYNRAGATYAQGDFDGNGTVNFDDLLILAKNYNKTLAAPAPAPAFAPVTAPVTSRSTVTSTSTAALLRDDSKNPSVFSTTRVPPKPAPTKPPTPPRPKAR